jgi:hypothetical protein
MAGAEVQRTPVNVTHGLDRPLAGLLDVLSVTEQLMGATYIPHGSVLSYTLMAVISSADWWLC